MPGEESASDRTEDATPRKRQQEREKGRVAKSRDLGAAGILLATAVLLKAAGGYMAHFLMLFTERVIGWDGQMANLLPPDGQAILPLALNWMLYLVLAVGPLLAGVLLVAMVSNYLQVGALFATKALEPDLNKLNPVSGFKRMFSLRSFMTLAMNLAKITLMAAVAWPTISAAVARAPIMMHAGDTAGAFVYLVEVVLDLAIKLAAVLLALGIADYSYQRYQMSQDMKMTRQQVKEEYKDTEGSPEIKQKRRQMQRQMAQQRMMQDVPGADVVIRNPTHYAVALKYGPDKPEPVVVAKGQDHLALKIIEVAKAARVPVWVEPPLARALYAAEVGQPIPAELYEAVAVVLAAVYRNAARKPAWMRDGWLAPTAEEAAAGR